MTITQRSKWYSQPRGGFLPPRQLVVRILEDQEELNPDENLPLALPGITVDCLTRFMLGSPAVKAFETAYGGAALKGETSTACELLAHVTGVDDESITAACQLAVYAAVYQSGSSAYRPVQDIRPDAPTIENIRKMVNRSMAFWAEYGPVTVSGLSFRNAYTKIIDAGEGDYLTNDTLWDFRVSRRAPTAQHTFQLLIHFIMGRRSHSKEFENVQTLGIFNPRLNTVYTIPVANVPEDVMDTVAYKVIGYEKP